MCEGMTALRMWQEHMLAMGSSQNTVRQYRYAVLRLLAETPKDSMREVTEQDVVVFLASLGKRAASRQLYFRAFRSFFGWAAERGHVDVDPSRHLKPKRASVPDADAYSPEELTAIIAASKALRNGERRAAAIAAAYALGLRRSELCGIKEEDVDWEAGRVYLRDTKGNKPRWVEMNDLARQSLELLAASVHPGLEVARGTLVGFSPEAFTQQVNEAAKAAGLPPQRRRAHMLRSSFATHLLGEGVPISVVSRLLGHSDIAVTSRYLKVDGSSRKDAVSRLPGLVAS